MRCKLIKDYIALQSKDKSLWYQSGTIEMLHLLKELKQVAWLIEKATVEEIKDTIETYKLKLGKE